MTDRTDYIVQLVLKKLRGEISEPEMAELESWVAENESHRQLVDQFDDVGFVVDNLNYMDKLDTEARWNKIAETLNFRPKSKVVKLFNSRFLAAACVLVVLSVALYLFFKPTSSSKTQPGKTTVAKVNEISPGTDNATLTLSDGTVIVLNKAGNGQISKQGSTIVNKQGGELVYQESKSIEHSSLTFNTLSTKRGEQYSLELPDKSRVFLNAATILRFPVSFSGNERKVELVSGEAYFEISKDKSKPFRVVVNSGIPSKTQTIEVLGTTFNIFAYQDERAIKTTLLEGSIKLSTNPNNTQSAILSPGQQATVSNEPASDIEVTKNADVESAVAWKNGTISFTRADIRTVLRQISRWYNVDVEVDPNVPAREFSASFSRQASIEEVMEMFKYLQIHCKIEDRKIVVIP